MEAHLTQLQVVVVGLLREVELISGITVLQSEVIRIQRNLILELDWGSWTRFEEFERRMRVVEGILDPRGRTFTNLIVIDLDADEVILVDE